ncbi:TetR/AcrR family transcriptional regulator [Arthrobacter sp.]|uniref:TetR/AcrR family transcriptional regulator n=1 Tax=Arthrobacter sp. TaxID=1667 RepID=UPI003A913789
MSRPPAAREKILDAYCSLLRTEGERAATMDATAALAGASKGGLLYHFPSKEALAEAVIERLLEAARQDNELMASAAEGAARYYVRTSTATDTGFDHIYQAVVRLAAGSHAPAVAALDRVHGDWERLVRQDVPDPHAAEAIMLIGEGLYFHSTLPGSWSRSLVGTDIDALLDQVDRLKEGC